MLKAVLFDLDDTLLGNDIDQFIPHYFGMLSAYASQYFEPQAFIQLLMAGTNATITNTDTAVTNRDVFWQFFTSQTGQDADEMEAFFNLFYSNQFDQLEAQTQRLPVARPLVKTCFAKELKVVIATNPLFPRSAIEARLRWAGVPKDGYAYDLVTTYENMHAAKPNPDYYREILDRIGVAPQAALMVGDSWVNDIEPASDVGLFTYWISLGRDLPDADRINGSGSLDTLYKSIQSGWLEQLGVPA